MIDPDALHVWYSDQLVGFLWRDEFGKMAFRYESDWLSGSGFPISQSLPPKKDEFQDPAAHRFFANLLPEGNARSRIVRELKIADSDFELLRAIGGECAGALSILPDDATPMAENDYRLISQESLERIIRRRGIFHVGLGEPVESRLSLAGAQDKVPVFVSGDQFYLPVGSSPSTHILKFEVSDYRHVPAYETYLTWVAQSAGLEVVDIQYHRTEAGSYTLSTRYDRQPGDPVTRIHQEDFCQALGKSAEQKYEQSADGISFADCYQILKRTSSLPIEDARRLIQWQAFNVLAGNSDAHAKNLSLLYLPGGKIRLAPFYDLVCTRAIERIDDKLAMAVGGEFRPGVIEIQHWHELARSCDARPAYVEKIVIEVARKLQDSLSHVRKEFDTKNGDYPALDRVDNVISRQLRRVDSFLG